MGHFCSGVVIVTGIEGPHPVGFTAQSFLSLSLEPPLIAVCPARSSTSWPRIRRAGHFGVNVLATNQRELCNRFASSGGTAGAGAKFEGITWEPGETGSPVLPAVLAFMDCRLEAEHDAGDHTIAIGRVVDLRVSTHDHSPLLFFRSTYGSFHALPGTGSAAHRGT
jgi:flavin reductase (DIM6/NTAB) family NADH-FMN oxidoreductase RutF